MFIDLEDVGLDLAELGQQPVDLFTTCFVRSQSSLGLFNLGDVLFRDAVNLLVERCQFLGKLIAAGGHRCFVDRNRTLPGRHFGLGDLFLVLEFRDLSVLMGDHVLASGDDGGREAFDSLGQLPVTSTRFHAVRGARRFADG